MFPGEKNVLTPDKGLLERGERYDPGIGRYPLNFAVPPVEHTSSNACVIDGNAVALGVGEAGKQIVDEQNHHQGR